MKKKQLWNIILICFLSLGMTSVYCSCGDDDEDEITINKGDENNNGGQDNTDDEDDSPQGVECRYCGGSGECSSSNCNNGKCINCNGKGYTTDGKYKFTCPSCNNGKCNACHGSGKCSKCGGRGYN